MKKSVLEIDNKFKVSIYPNSSSNQVNISSEQIIDEIEIKDVLGKVFYHTKPDDKNISLVIDQVGVYFVTLKSKQQTRTRRLIIKNWQ